MANRSTKSRNHSELIDKTRSAILEGRWYSYALAGAGAVAAAPQAHATIMFTPGPITITAHCTAPATCSNSASIHLAGVDGDFTLTATLTSAGSAELFFAGSGANPAGAYRNGGTLDTPSLTAGTSIGPHASGFSYVPTLHQLNPSAVWAPSGSTLDGFLALQFHLSTDPNPGDVNFGWAEISRNFNTSSSTYTVVVEGFAYESNPNTPINAGETSAVPEPGTAGMALLALGASGLAAWRKRKQAQKSV